MFCIENETRGNKYDCDHDIDDPEDNKVEGFNIPEKEMTIVEEAQEAHNAECTKNPDYLKVLLGKKEGNNGGKVNK